MALTMFGVLPFYTHFYSIVYYLFFYVIFGVFQAAGWPNEVTIMVRTFNFNNNVKLLYFRQIGSQRIIVVLLWVYGQHVNQSETSLELLSSH